MIYPNDYPQLKLITWNRDPAKPIPEEDVLGIYEGHWRWVDQESLCAKEQALIDHLVKTYGKGVLHV